MKKLIVLVLTLSLTIGAASAAMAATLGVSLGRAGVDYGEQDFSFNQVVVNYDMPVMEDLQAGVSLAYGTSSDDTDANIQQIILKGEYALLNEERYQLAVAGGYYSHHVEANPVLYNPLNHSNYILHITNDYDTVFLGLSGKLRTTDLSWIDLYYAMGFAKIDDNNFGMLSCKLYYMLRPRISVSLGYFSEIIDQPTGGITLGAIYKL